MIAAGIAKLGFVADLLSKPTQIGYMNGLALTILIGQLPKLFGFSIDANGLIDEAQGVRARAGRRRGGRRRGRGRRCSASPLILVLGRWLPRVPGVLVAVVVAIAASAAFDLGDHGVSLVGTLPKGFPPLTVPDVRYPTCRCWSPGRSGSRSSRSPTRSRRPRRSPPAPARRSTATAR